MCASYPCCPASRGSCKTDGFVFPPADPGPSRAMGGILPGSWVWPNARRGIGVSMIRKLAILIVPLTLGACAATPEYPVRPDQPRSGFELPKPAYPITPQPEDAGPPPAPVGALASATSSLSPDTATYYRPEPIPGAPPPPDQAARRLSGRTLESRPTAAARSARPPAPEIPREVVVRPGESLFEVAERVRTPVRALIDLNGLEPPYDVSPGQVIRIPPPTVYIVKAGDTLFSVSRRFSMDPRSLANFNGIALEAPLKLGQKLVLPALVKDGETLARIAPAPIRLPEPTAASKPRPSPMLSNGTSAANPPAPAPARPEPLAEPEAVSASAAAAAGKGRFVWPLKGDILSSFGPKGPGQRNDGVNISAEVGAPVYAAASGQVVYAGNTIPGFGNLVVIKHPDGWTSLYGNLGKILVKIRSEVTQGQELGLAGLSGAVDRPQIHFEVRYAASPQEKARPVDPQTLLP